MPTKYVCPPAFSPAIMTPPRGTKNPWFWKTSGKNKYRNRVFCMWRTLAQANALVEESFNTLWGSCSSQKYQPCPNSHKELNLQRGSRMFLQNPHVGLSNSASLEKLPGNNLLLHHTGWNNFFCCHISVKGVTGVLWGLGNCAVGFEFPCSSSGSLWIWLLPLTDCWKKQKALIYVNQELLQQS